MPPRMDGDFQGTAALPHTLRGQSSRRWMSDAWPQMTDAGVVERSQRPDSWLEPVFDCTGVADEAWALASLRWKDDDGRIYCRLLETGDDWQAHRTVREEKTA